MNGFIYVWENRVNGMKYIGKRWGDPSGNYIGSGKYFKRAVEKYGLDQFERTILEFCSSKEELKTREKYWLDFYNVASNPLFYNIIILIFYFALKVCDV